MKFVNKMENKSFTIKKKSAIKKDKAIGRLQKWENLLFEIAERKSLLMSQETRAKEGIKREQKIIKENT